MFEQRRKNDQAKRARLQAKLTTPAPSLSEALPLYTKGALTGMGRAVLPWGGWSGFRKAELVEELVNALGEGSIVDGIVAQLNDTDQEALREVLARGGQMPWAELRCEDDLDESSHWEYHEPETTMGRLRLRGLLVEATVDGELLITVPSELRPLLEKALA